MMIRPDEYPQVERRAGDQGPARRGVSGRPGGNAAAQLSMALPRNFPETDIHVR